MKANGDKFAVLTAYDFTFSKLIENAEIEVVLVGDSLGNVIQGRDSTIPVTVDEMRTTLLPSSAAIIAHCSLPICRLCLMPQRHRHWIMPQY